VKTVLDLLGLRDELKEEPRSQAGNRFDQDREIVSDVVDAHACESLEFSWVIGGHPVVIKSLSPESCNR
jgi:hypothetical protein